MGERSAGWRGMVRRVGDWFWRGRRSLPPGASSTATIVRTRANRPADALQLFVVCVGTTRLMAWLGMRSGLLVVVVVLFAWWAVTDRRIPLGRIVLDEHRLWVAGTGRWLGPIDLRSVVAIDGRIRGLGRWRRLLVLYVPTEPSTIGVRARPSSVLARRLGNHQQVRGLRVFASTAVMSWLTVIVMLEAPAALVSTELSARLGVVPGAPPPPAVRSAG